jgi:glycosyltransferase involved in cell wall biosynthesis
MKILVVSTSSGSRGGGELSLLYLGKALSERGNEVSLWVSGHPRMDELAEAFARFGAVIRSDYTNTYDRRGRSIRSYLDGRTARRVAREWRKLAPDVVHLNKQNLEDGLDLCEALRRSGLPGLAMIHITQTAGYLKAALAWPRDFVSRRALRSFPGLLVTTPGARQRDLAEFVGSGDRTRCIHNGVPIPDAASQAAWRVAARGEHHYADNDFLFVAVGRMVPQKRPLLFLQTAEKIHRRMPEARFLWVGDGDLTGEWDAWVADRQLGAIIRRLPWQTSVPRLLSAADAFMHVADFEGLAFAILEALASGLPCAITANLLDEMPFLNAENSIAIEPDEDWIEALRDPARLKRIGQAARLLAETQFSYGRMAAEYEALYEESRRLLA